MPEDTATTAETTTPDDAAAQLAEVTWDSLGMSPAEAAKAIAESQKWEKRSKENFAKLKDAEPKLAEYEQLRAAQQTDAERQAEELNRAQTLAEQWRTTAVTSRIEALAAPDFEFPADAVGKLDPAKYLDVGGVIDEAAIRADLAEVLAERPNWRRHAEGSAGPRPPIPNPAQGSNGGGGSSDPVQQFAAIVRSQIGGG